MTALAIKYGVSSSYLARICTRLNVPRPERGYWAKLAAGKNVKQLSLPVAQPEDELEWSREGDVPYKKRSLPAPPKAVRKKRRKKSDQLSSHHLIRGARDLFIKGKVTEDGYLKPNKKLLIDMLVSEPQLDAALNIMNQVLLAFESFDYRTVIAPSHENFLRHSVDERDKPGKRPSYINQWSPYRPTVVYVGSVAIGFTLYEISEAVEVLYVNGDYIPVSELKSDWKRRRPHSWTTTIDRPSGRLCLQAYSPYPGTTWAHQWYFRPNIDLVKLGNKVAKTLNQHATTISELVAEAERLAEIRRKQWEEEDKEWRREQEERRKANALKDSKNELMKIINHWAEVKSIEGIFREVEDSIENSEACNRELLSARLLKAREMIGKVDALQELADWESPVERQCVDE